VRLDNQRYVVTGASGFIGSNFVDNAIAHGCEVCAIDNFSDYYDRRVKLSNSTNFEVVDFDLKSDDIENLLNEGDVVIHLAGQPGVRDSFGGSFSFYVEDNITATSRLLEACRKKGISRMVFASTSSVYGDVTTSSSRETDQLSPVSPYGVTKMAAEGLVNLYARNFGLDVVVLRLFTVYGPRQRPDMAFAKIFQSALTGNPFRVNGSGEQLRDFTFVDDVVEAISAVVSTVGLSSRTFNVGGGQTASLRDAISVAESVCGARVPLEFVASPVGEPFRTGADTSRLRSETGWEPRTGIEEGMTAQFLAMTRS
jgi:nucleoside-diphosphate-sugar epimerase